MERRKLLFGLRLWCRTGDTIVGNLHLGGVVIRGVNGGRFGTWTTGWWGEFWVVGIVGHAIGAFHGRLAGTGLGFHGSRSRCDVPRAG